MRMDNNSTRLFSCVAAGGPAPSVSASHIRFLRSVLPSWWRRDEDISDARAATRPQPGNWSRPGWPVQCRQAGWCDRGVLFQAPAAPGSTSGIFFFLSSFAPVFIAADGALRSLQFLSDLPAVRKLITSLLSQTNKFGLHLILARLF